MSERMMAWRCIGCGRLEAAQPCIGVCQDRPVELVLAADHDRIVAEAERRIAALTGFLREFAGTTPREGAWEASYRALQERARAALRKIAAGETAPGELDAGR
jgi:hypothetical protein